MRKRVFWLAVAMTLFLILSPIAFAGPFTKTLSVFPHVTTTEQIEIPTIEGVDETKCSVDLTGVFEAKLGECYSELNESCHSQQERFMAPSCEEERKQWGFHCDEPVLFEDLFEETCEIITTTDMSKVLIDCPPDSVQTGIAYIPVTYDKLVTKASVGDTIDVLGTLWSRKPRTITYWMKVVLVIPGVRTKVLFRSPKTTSLVNDTATIEIPYTFPRTGIFRFELRILKPDGTIGIVASKVIVE